MTNKIVLIGAGSATFGLEMLGDIFASKTLSGSSVVLHDINPQALKKVNDIALSHISKNSLDFQISATNDRKQALKDASFIIISIEVGNRFLLWEQDWRIPQQLGNKQIYGENGGPGGLFHSLRIIPSIIEICQDIVAICPDAYIFSLSNPHY
ncbi:unnamed protein product [marine sediment metagenome]|uniref:Glycosyl hydrolase family 4 C-terminal domain-containing protein n=1 Tax=marine sediment metagenome TaxID=412755 RepID=X1BPL7_9ZZZZ